MTIELDERNGHAAAAVTHIFLARLERRLAEVTKAGEQHLEQRVVVLRDAVVDFVAEELEWRDEETSKPGTTRCRAKAKADQVGKPRGPVIRKKNIKANGWQ